MHTEKDIIILAENKLKAAEVLLENGLPDEAFYIGGYSLELILKARICKTLCVPDFFLFDSKMKQEAYKPFKVHDYEQLLVLSGLYQAYSDEKKKDKNFDADWSIVCEWTENIRYKLGYNENEVRSFLTSLKNVATWLRQHL